MPTIMDCSGPNLSCWLCPFATITQKGLTTHLQQLHNISYRTKTRPEKSARSRRKNAAPRETTTWPNGVRPYACSLCLLEFTTKEELSRHHQQAHGGGGAGNPTHNETHFHCAMANAAPGSSGTSRGGRAHPRPEQSPYHYRCQPAPQHSHAVRHNLERPMYGQGYGVNQIPMRAEILHAQAPAMQMQEPVARSQQLDRGQSYEAQRSPTDWANYRSSVQTPQAMSAEFASTIEGRVDETANAWNPQMTSQRMEDGNMQLWSNMDQMQSSQYDPRKELLNLSDAVNSVMQPCAHCGCASRGGCTQKAVISDDVNRIILVEEESGGASNGGESHQVYHLQAGTSFGDLKASNFKQVVSQGDEIVLEYHTEDGRELLLKAIRAGAEAEEQPLERTAENDELVLALASSSINAAEIKSEANEVFQEGSNSAEGPSLAQNEPEAPEPNMQPAEESMQSTLPQLFPELFEGNPLNSENESISWPFEGTEEADSFHEVYNRSEYLAALSHCRGFKDDSGALHLKCGRCLYCTEMGNPMEQLQQLQIHIRQHLNASFQCRTCEFTCAVREEMVVHVGTQHDVPNSEPSY